MYRVCLMYNLRIAAISLSTGTVTHPVGFPPEVTKVAFPPWRPPFRLPEPGLAPGAKVKRLVWPDSSWESEILMVWIIQFLGMSLKHPIESHWKSIDHTENHSVVIVVAECIPQKRTLEFLLFSRLSPISDFLESPGNLKPRNWAVVKFHQQVGNLLFGTVRFWARLNWNHQESELFCSTPMHAFGAPALAGHTCKIKTISFSVEGSMSQGVKWTMKNTLVVV